MIYNFLKLIAVSRSLIAETIAEENLQPLNDDNMPLENQYRRLKVENFARLFGKELIDLQTGCLGEKANRVRYDDEYAHYFYTYSPAWGGWVMYLGGLAALLSYLIMILSPSKPDTHFFIWAGVAAAGTGALSQLVRSQVIGRVDEIEDYERQYHSNCNLLFSHKRLSHNQPVPILEIVEPNAHDNIATNSERIPLLINRVG